MSRFLHLRKLLAKIRRSTRRGLPLRLVALRPFGIVNSSRAFGISVHVVAVDRPRTGDDVLAASFRVVAGQVFECRQVAGILIAALADANHRVEANAPVGVAQESTCHHRVKAEIDGRGPMPTRAHHRDRPLLLGGMNEQRPRWTLPGLVPGLRRVQVPDESLSIGGDATCPCGRGRWRRILQS